MHWQFASDDNHESLYRVTNFDFLRELKIFWIMKPSERTKPTSSKRILKVMGVRKHQTLVRK